ncbi:hypothetical protein OC844_006426 [Tilletia horrida]|nr:hypothetical protein OC844_006426 [Tilletia horrida]
MASSSPLGPAAGPSSPSPSPSPSPSALGVASPSPSPAPFRTSSAPFRTDVVRRTALSTATLLRTSSKQGGGGGGGGGANGPGGLASSLTGLLGGDVDGAQLSEAQLAKLEENVNLKIDNELQILLDGFLQIVGLSMIRDKDRYLLAQESYQAEMRAHNMVRAAQALTLLSASLKLSLILALEPGEQEEKAEGKDEGPTAGQPQSARELIEDTERLRARCAELLGNLGVGLGHASEPVLPAGTETGDNATHGMGMALDESNQQGAS